MGAWKVGGGRARARSRTRTRARTSLWMFSMAIWKP